MKTVIFGVALPIALKAVKKVWDMKCRILKFCTECGVDCLASDTNNYSLCRLYSGRELADVLEYTFCVGCFCLFRFVKDMKTKYRMILRLLYGEDEGLNKDDPTLVAAKYSRTARRMRVRAALKSNLAPGVLNIATRRELMDLIITNGPNDAILGHRLFVKDGSKFNGLTFDHIIPVSTVKNDLDAFNINNIQLMSKCLNDVKGACHDYEHILWLVTLLGCYLDRYGL